MVIYEQPLNEKIRLFMRLEHMFDRFNYFINEDSIQSSQSALELLLDLHDMSSRIDIKSAILKLIDHQTMTLREVSDEKETRLVLDELAQASEELYNFHGQFSQYMKDHNFLNFVKQRLNISGGLNKFEAPLFSLWINQPTDIRREQLQNWVKPFMKSQDAIILVMKLIRNSAEQSECVADDGFFQSTLRDTHKKYHQLLRIHIPHSYSFYPEVSAGKQRFSIRFVSIDDLSERGNQVREDVNFTLNVCGF